MKLEIECPNCGSMDTYAYQYESAGIWDDSVHDVLKKEFGKESLLTGIVDNMTYRCKCNECSKHFAAIAILEVKAKKIISRKNNGRDYVVESYGRRDINMDYKIQNTYPVTETHEFSVDWNGWRFLVIYGHHINGWFIAILNWNVCTEAGHPTSDDYNATKLAQTHIHDTAPVYLARVIREHWEGLEK